MRDAFYGFFQPTDPDFQALWDDGIVVLDTNALLNLYRYTQKSRNELLGAIQSLSGRLWLPHRIGVEFHRKRIDLIREQRRFHERITESLKKVSDYADSQMTPFAKNPFFDIKGAVAEIRRSVEKVSEAIGSVRDRDLEAYGITVHSDPVLDTLDTLFGGNVGNDLTEDEWQAVRDEGETRYLAHRPPGYLDAKKEGDDKYGDLVIWKQIITLAKSRESNVIFVTDDAKDDWWWKSDGETIGPRPELRAEFRNETGKMFYAYRVERFVRQLKDASGSSVSAEAVEEVRETSMQAAQLAEARLELSILEEEYVRKMSEYRDAQNQHERARVELESVRNASRRYSDALYNDSHARYAPGSLTTNANSEIREIRSELSHNENLLFDVEIGERQRMLVERRNIDLQDRLQDLLAERERFQHDALSGKALWFEERVRQSENEAARARSRAISAAEHLELARQGLEAFIPIDELPTRD